MNEILTIDEINQRFPDEWALVGDPETDEMLEVLGGEGALSRQEPGEDVSGGQGSAFPKTLCNTLYRGVSGSRRGVHPVIFRFNPALNLIFVRGDAAGPNDSAVMRLAVDTASSHTVFDTAALDSIGIEIKPGSPKMRLRTPTGEGTAFKTTVERLSALGRERTTFPLSPTNCGSGSELTPFSDSTSSVTTNSPSISTAAKLN